ncbi:MAG: membrane protein insertion efficiency factor YidD [Flavobacteriales bacterium]|nr:membrane protein insertion efficiency factor YidD [Flavobacteriales bacterium]MCB0808159.1 membrane protein insertion efficiency factor YidD [Flavobacteriales bacterium]MCB0813624.1 membrane protein insertion efficiency factor YidD [Flavobacteriales bacterium]
MRMLLCIPIRLYWRFFPQRWKRNCLYRVSCSHHVYARTRSQGLVAGFAALRERIQTCNARHTWIDNGSWSIVLADGRLLPEGDINPVLLNSMPISPARSVSNTLRRNQMIAYEP